MDAASVEVEIQSLMNIDIFDSDGNGGSYDTCERDNSDADYSKESNELVSTRIPVIGEGKIHQLLAKHSILSGAFIFAATSWPEEDKDLLTSTLSSLQNIWIQPQWEVYLKNLCCNNVFRRDVLKIVKFFEDELHNCRVETVLHQTRQISYSTLVSLLPLILPPVLKLLRFVHALWADGVVFCLPEELKEAKRMNSCEQFLCVLGKALKHRDDEVEENDLGKWLQQIRESGYNFLGLCAHIKGAFSELLDSLTINESILENMSSIEFWHLTRLIDLTIIPFAKHCPRKLWEEWMLKLLLPLIIYCEEMLRYSWQNLLHTGQAYVPFYLGYVCESKGDVNIVKKYLLVDLTRSVCKLLGALSSPELNGLFCLDLNSVNDLITASCKSKCTLSSSMVGYILLNDCFKSLSMDLFGWWVDGEATIDVVPFCNALVQVTVATNNERLRCFVEDDMLPALIRRLCDDLPCMIQRAISMLSNQVNCHNEKASRDLLVLCQKIYTLCVRSQDFEGKGLDNGNKAYQFDDWLAKQKKDLILKSNWRTPEGFPLSAEFWNWEFEEKFQRRLPIYIDMLHEVNRLNDCLKHGYSKQGIFENLSVEFKTRHAINSCMDSDVLMISDILGRKMHAVYWEQRSTQMFCWLSELITSKPYIKVSDSWESVMNHLTTNFVIDLNNFEMDAKEAVDVFFKCLLYFWEPRFHPLIREAQKDKLIEIARQLVFAEHSKYYVPLDFDVEDFTYHLKPYASSYIYRKKKDCGYFRARRQVDLHEKFDKYLSLGELDDDICKFCSEDDFVNVIVDKHFVKSEFAELDLELIKVSLKQRAQILVRQHQMDAYYECLRSALADEKNKDCLEELINKLDREGFFDVSNDSINWESFQGLVGSFENLVFRGLPRHLVVQGIMDYREISQQSGITWQDSYAEVVEVVSHRWRNELEEVWMYTRCYDDSYYDLLRQPLEKIFPQDSCRCQISKINEAENRQLEQSATTVVN